MSVGAKLAPICSWLVEPLSKEVTQVLERLRAAEGIEQIAVMPDVHLSGEFCIGTVVASADRIYPLAVGGDIGCGIATARFHATADEVLSEEQNARALLRALRILVPTNRHSRRTCCEELPDGLEERSLSVASLENRRRRDGRVQFATLGRGNHFLELQEDDEGALWVMVHSGSRAMGQVLTAHHLDACTVDASGVRSLSAESPEGRAYLDDVAWARDYAHASRLAMIDAVAVLLDEWHGVEVDTDSLVSCDHNHVFRETHDGRALWVHRKGALRADAGDRAVIPGSMGTPSYHVEGRGEPKALRSSSHGAGRAIRRAEARAAISGKELRRQLLGVWFDPALEDPLREEAPGVYKAIGRVMRAQRDLTRIVRRVRPRLCYKGV
jgi:tRNA-splicing ligase RtcB